MNIFLFFILSLCLLSSGLASAKNKGACLKADNLHRVEAGDECLALQTFVGSDKVQGDPVLVVFLHGDSPKGWPADYLRNAAHSVTSSGVISVVLIRPGYYDSEDHYSTGTSYRFVGDGYRPYVVDTVASAIKVLKDFYHAHVILVGHSGGAAISAVILGRYPQLAEGAVLAALPSNMKALRALHFWFWDHSLSPDAFVKGIAAQAKVKIIVGEKDTVVPPFLSVNYAKALEQRDITHQLLIIPGATHNSVVRTPVFLDAISELIESLKIRAKASYI